MSDTSPQSPAAKCDELKPCPFCGEKSIAIHDDHDSKPLQQTHISYWGYCNACSAEGRWADSTNEAIQFWNTRHFPEPPADEGLEVIAEKAVIKLMEYDNMDFNEDEQYDHIQRIKTILSALNQAVAKVTKRDEAIKQCQKAILALTKPKE
jgi:Lar family restriction alleviation protein